MNDKFLIIEKLIDNKHNKITLINLIKLNYFLTIAIIYNNKLNLNII